MVSKRGVRGEASRAKGVWHGWLLQGVSCVHNSSVMELMRGVRSQLGELITGLAGADMAPMSLGLSHSLSRYKLKFSPDKVPPPPPSSSPTPQSSSRALLSECLQSIPATILHLNIDGHMSFLCVCLCQVDTMIVQAIGLLDDLDKELNTYAMRVREWYGWHFPELAKIVADNIQYAKSVRLMGPRDTATDHDFSGVSARYDGMG